MSKMIFSFTNCHRVVHARLGLGLGFASLSANSILKTHYSPCSFASSFVIDELPSMFKSYRSNQRRTLTRVACWDSTKSPYETLELERDADEEKIKISYRRLAKTYHPDVYDGSAKLDEGETAEARFIKIQAAYELLIDQKKRKEYDTDHRINPLKASEAWMEWLIKKRKAFEQRGDLAFNAWAEQQHLEMTIRARNRSRNKVDPEEVRRLLAKEKAAYKEFYETTLRRHTLVLRKRDIMRRKAEEERKKELSHLLAKAEEEKKKNDLGYLLALEGLELDTEDEDNER